MFHPKQMTKLLIAASKDHIEEVIGELYKRRLFHIEDYVRNDLEEWSGYSIGMSLTQADQISSELVKIRSIISNLEINQESMPLAGYAKQNELSKKIESDLPGIAARIEALLSKRSGLDAEQKDLEQKIEGLKPFIAFEHPLELLSGHQAIGLLAGYVKGTPTLPDESEVFTSPAKNGEAFTIVAVRTEKVAECERALLDAQFHKVTIPQEREFASAAIERYQQQNTALESEIKRLDEELETVKKQHQLFFVSSEELLTAEIQQAEAPLRFATTEHAFVIEGFVPTTEAAEVMESLVAVTGGKIEIQELEIKDPNNEPPVDLQNPGFAQPTEALINLYTAPKYTEIDPSLVMSVLYPLMFGFILGDVGYGAILLVMSLALRGFVKGSDMGEKLMKVLRNCSISAIVFGIAFSEFLGMSLPWHPVWLSRHLNIGGGAEHGLEYVTHIPELLIITIWVGLFHLTLGRIWGARNAYVMDHGEHRSKLMFACIGWVLVMWGIVIAVWSYFPLPLMPDLTGLPYIAGFSAGAAFGVLCLLIGIVLIARDSVIELMEIPTIISNVLSYTRLVAVGLSSVAIALVTNFIAIKMIIDPALADFTVLSIVLIIAGIAVFLFGHTLNTALGLLGGGVHPLRLHYVEFFTKFYRGGGKKYDPFGMLRKYTEAEK
ncbi:MAG: V-type ATP synthase subunit I [Euryarchaeota archaeon]|nr:V-type ATP synthase subunit I [Euryarchaeota archaeon]